MEIDCPFCTASLVPETEHECDRIVPIAEYYESLIAAEDPVLFRALLTAMPLPYYTLYYQWILYFRLRPDDTRFNFLCRSVPPTAVRAQVATVRFELYRRGLIPRSRLVLPATSAIHRLVLSRQPAGTTPNLHRVLSLIVPADPLAWRRVCRAAYRIGESCLYKYRQADITMRFWFQALATADRPKLVWLLRQPMITDASRWFPGALPGRPPHAYSINTYGIEPASENYLMLQLQQMQSHDLVPAMIWEEALRLGHHSERFLEQLLNRCIAGQIRVSETLAPLLWFHPAPQRIARRYLSQLCHVADANAFVHLYCRYPEQQPTNGAQELLCAWIGWLRDTDRSDVANLLEKAFSDKHVPETLNEEMHEKYMIEIDAMTELVEQGYDPTINYCWRYIDPWYIDLETSYNKLIIAALRRHLPMGAELIVLNPDYIDRFNADIILTNLDATTREWIVRQHWPAGAALTRFDHWQRFRWPTCRPHVPTDITALCRLRSARVTDLRAATVDEGYERFFFGSLLDNPFLLPDYMREVLACCDADSLVAMKRVNRLTYRLVHDRYLCYRPRDYTLTNWQRAVAGDHLLLQYLCDRPLAPGEMTTEYNLAYITDPETVDYIRMMNMLHFLGVGILQAPQLPCERGDFTLHELMTRTFSHVRDSAILCQFVKYIEYQYGGVAPYAYLVNNSLDRPELWPGIVKTIKGWLTPENVAEFVGDLDRPDDKTAVTCLLTLIIEQINPACVDHLANFVANLENPSQDEDEDEEQEPMQID